MVNDELDRGLATESDAQLFSVATMMSDLPVGYETATAFMERRAAGIAEGSARETLWFLEHPPLYTAGKASDPADLVEPDRFPVYTTGRGGQYTYHGPGQRIVYVMLDLNRRGRDVRKFVTDLEEWLIRTLDTFQVRGERRKDRVGVWVRRPDKGHGTEDKIAAMGIRMKRWISLHGISLNVEPNLSHFDGIVPCGIREHGVTSLVDLGLPVTMHDVDLALRENFETVFRSRLEPPEPFSRSL